MQEFCEIHFASHTYGENSTKDEILMCIMQTTTVPHTTVYMKPIFTQETSFVICGFVRNIVPVKVQSSPIKEDSVRVRAGLTLIVDDCTDVQAGFTLAYVTGLSSVC